MGKAQERYKAKSVLKVYVEFNRNTDRDLVEWLDAVQKDGGRNRAIKQAIRQYLTDHMPTFAKEGAWPV